MKINKWKFWKPVIIGSILGVGSTNLYNFAYDRGKTNGIERMTQEIKSVSQVIHENYEYDTNRLSVYLDGLLLTDPNYQQTSKETFRDLKGSIDQYSQRILGVQDMTKALIY